ncbi:MAG TPA: hypothetical protein VL595_08295, partial [Pseudonocardia sp.]|nr:hypothetical protein [Pseudonocardia sp.]
MSEHRNDTILITGVRPYGGDPVDMLLRDGVIAEIGTGLSAPEDAEVIDGGDFPGGLIALPGFVDLHTHL